MGRALTMIRIKCDRLLKYRHFRLCAGSVILTTGLFVYMFVMYSSPVYMFLKCPSPVYVDKSLEHTLFISLTSEGRTGNHLFKYASLLGIANRTGRRPVVPLDYSLRNLFDLSHVEDIDNSCWVYKREERSAEYDPRLYDLPLTNVNVREYLQSWKYFDHIEQTIRSEYTFKHHIQTQAEELFKRYAKYAPRHSVVGVHVRRGDHLTDYFKNLGYTMADEPYFKRAMNYMRSKVGNVTFIIVGDDLPWAKDNFDSPDIVVADDLPAGVHLAILSLCGHVIQSTGTFSWWAGWFVPGHVVYYNDYPAVGSWLEERTNKKDHYPPHWVAL